jgi:hypothetical protein
MVYNGGGQWQSSNASGWLDNQTKSQLDRWQKPGDVTDVPQAVFLGNEYSGTNASSRYLSDASYLRMKSVSFGYSLPASVVERMKLRSLRFYATATNLFTWTNYAGWDPEVSWLGTNRSTTTANIMQGQDFYTAPQAQTITVGINVGL